MAITPFRKRLRETMQWCARLADPSRPAECLRTPELRLRSLEGTFLRTVWSIQMTREHLLSRIARDRRREYRLACEAAAAPDARGRLLLYFPDDDLADGAAETASNGFFDLHNTPPWDTWVALFDFRFLEDEEKEPGGRTSYLIAWVPSPLIALAGRGIDVNPGGCIAWLDHSQMVRAQKLLSIGLSVDPMQDSEPE